jgi:hypothetical protein
MLVMENSHLLVDGISPNLSSSEVTSDMLIVIRNCNVNHDSVSHCIPMSLHSSVKGLVALALTQDITILLQRTPHQGVVLP